MELSNSSEPDSVASFAADLRSLRLAADSPTLARLQHDTGISRTVLSDAFRGMQLPSVRTVDRIVRACGDEPAEWLRRRDALSDLSRPARAVDDAANDDAADAEGAADEPRHPVLVRRSLAVWAAVGAFLMGGVVTGLAGAAVAGAAQGPASVEPRAQVAVETGMDPGLTPCVTDAEPAASTTYPDGTVVEIQWSDACFAGWARVARADGLATGNSVSVSIYPQDSPQGPDRQSATEDGVQNAYTMLIVKPSSDARLCAVGSITVDGAESASGEPICT